MKTTTKTTYGRPVGKRFDRRIDIRIPKPMLASVRKRARETKVSPAEFIRQCIELRFTKETAFLVGTVRDKEATGWKKLWAINRMHELRKAVLACSVWGLQQARMKARNKSK